MARFSPVTVSVPALSTIGDVTVAANVIEFVPPAVLAREIASRSVHALLPAQSEGTAGPSVLVLTTYGAAAAARVGASPAYARSITAGIAIAYRAVETADPPHRIAGAAGL